MLRVSVCQFTVFALFLVMTPVAALSDSNQISQHGHEGNLVIGIKRDSEAHAILEGAYKHKQCTFVELARDRVVQSP
jgi:hypothetical protein